MLAGYGTSVGSDISFGRGSSFDRLSLDRGMSEGDRFSLDQHMRQRPDLSNDLVVRALNYHGQQLTSFVKESQLYEQLELKNVDYHLYHQASTTALEKNVKVVVLEEQRVAHGGSWQETSPS